MSFRKILNSTQNTVTGAAVILTIAVLLSRVLGLVRDRLLAGSFGASIDLDIYFAAFRIPDLVYGILFAGGVIVSLLPLFSEIHCKDKEKSWDVINNILNIFFVSYIISSILFFIYTPQIIASMVSGFDASSIQTTIDLTRLIFVSVFFFGVSSIFSTVLNYFNRFVVYSLAPILYNLGIIFGIIFLAPYFGVFGVAMGVIIGSVLHFLVQIPSAIKCGYKYKFIIDFKNPAIREFFGLLIPRTIASSSSQINFIFITFIASGIGAGAISVFNLSNNLRYLPIGIIGVSFATAIFPLLSKLWAESKKEEYFKEFRKVFNEVMYISFPIGILIFILREQIVDIVLKTGNFDVSAVTITAAALGLYFISTAIQCLVPLLLRGFFSLKDTITPTIISILSVLASIYMSFLFVSIYNGDNFLVDATKMFLGVNGAVNFSVLGLVVAFNLGMILEFSLLFYFFYKTIGDFGVKQIVFTFLKILFSSTIMGIAAWNLLPCLKGFFGSSFTGSLIEFSLVCLVSFLIYGILTIIFKMSEVRAVKKLIIKNED
ncbi:MAG: murein biosynthesis integral membrane protein MurJ [Candidatus Paceibacterota bacterium]|jgi:putative peptidoglycan lipid II flippase